MTSTMTPALTSTTLGHSRAALRPVRPGATASCAGCHQAVKFAARIRRHQVIANVYVDGYWDRVEHFHPECYDRVDRPHGPPSDAPHMHR